MPTKRGRPPGSRIHGYVPSRHPLYVTWAAMKQRCHNPEARGYQWYGKKGIVVCQRWAHSFADFVRDMGPRPDATTLDRIDSDGNYEPDNCRWGTRAQQQATQRIRRGSEHGRAKLDEVHLRRVRWLASQGVSYRAIAREFGLDHKTVSQAVRLETWRYPVPLVRKVEPAVECMCKADLR